MIFKKNYTISDVKKTNACIFLILVGFSDSEVETSLTFKGGDAVGHGSKFERISSKFNFEWTKVEFSKNRNKFESLCSNFELSIQRASDISPFHLLPRGPLDHSCCHLANRGRTGAET